MISLFFFPDSVLIFDQNLVYRHMSSVLQDCKEFQGELFGICNLFRDLSDKLFTSEIIEMHEKKGKYLATQMKPLNPESENYVTLTPMEASEISFHGKSNEAAIFEDEKKLQELGKVIYNYQLFLIMQAEKKK